jgi:UDP-N-acetylmuramate dehydrogenase
MHPLDAFPDIVKPNERLAPYVHLRLGGPAEYLVQPRSREELSAVVRRCFQERLPLRILGGGCNVLVRDEGVKGVVLRLSEPAFTQVSVEGNQVKAGTGAAVSALISQAARHGLAGLESLVGISGTVGGALRCNAGDSRGDISQFVRQVEVLDSRGEAQVRERDELRFGYHSSNLDDPVILSAEFRLESESPDAIVKRMRRAWIQRKASQPLSYEPACRVFRNPRALSAAALIDEAGLARTRVGGAEVSERDSNYIVVHPEASTRDVMRLIDLIRSRVQERFNVELELEVTIW